MLPVLTSLRPRDPQVVFWDSDLWQTRSLWSASFPSLGSFVPIPASLRASLFPFYFCSPLVTDSSFKRQHMSTDFEKLQQRIQEISTIWTTGKDNSSLRVPGNTVIRQNQGTNGRTDQLFTGFVTSGLLGTLQALILFPLVLIKFILSNIGCVY